MGTVLLVSASFIVRIVTVSSRNRAVAAVLLVLGSFVCYNVTISFRNVGFRLHFVKLFGGSLLWLQSCSLRLLFHVIM